MKAPIVTQELEIHSYETDPNSRIKAVALQNLLQEMAYKGSDFCNCGQAVMQSKNLFWALNRIHFRILDTPMWGDEVILQTWSYGQAGPLWHRNFKMVRPGAPDTPIVLGTSAWTIVNISERSICREDPGFDATRHYPVETLPLCTKIQIPAGLESALALTHDVVWSDLDINGHANNCAYTRWAMDALPADFLNSHIIKDVEVNYYHEIHLGEKVELHLARTDGTWFVTGKTGDKVCFVEKLDFA